MAPRPRLPALILVAAQGINAATYLRRSQYCVAACSAALNHVSFDGKQPASASHESPVPCTNRNYIDSLFYCASTYCSSKEARSGLSHNNETCLFEAGTALPSFEIFLGHLLTGEASNVMRVSEKDTKKETFTQPVIPAQDFYDLGYDSTVSHATLSS